MDWRSILGFSQLRPSVPGIGSRIFRNPDLNKAVTESQILANGKYCELANDVFWPNIAVFTWKHGIHLISSGKNIYCLVCNTWVGLKVATFFKLSLSTCFGWILQLLLELDFVYFHVSIISHSFVHPCTEKQRRPIKFEEDQLNL